GFFGARVFAVIQPDESVGMATRRGPRNFLHAELPQAPGRQRLARGERIQGIHDGNVKSAATLIDGAAGVAVSEGACDQSSFAGVERSRRNWLSADPEAEHRWKRSRNQEIFIRGRVKGSG